MFYDVFINLCKENKISPSRAAINAGLNKSAVAKWKNGTIPSGAALSSIAEHFGVTVDYLLGSPSTASLKDENKPSTNEGEGPKDEWEKLAIAILNRVPPERRAEALFALHEELCKRGLL